MMARSFICSDIDPETAKRAAEQFDIPHVFTDYKKMLEMEEIDAVIAVIRPTGPAAFQSLAVRSRHKSPTFRNRARISAMRHPHRLARAARSQWRALIS